MNYILFDDNTRNDLLPLTYTRPVADIRVGILTIREKWEKVLGAKTSTKTEVYLSDKYPLVTSADTDNVWINGSFCPDKIMTEEIKTLGPNQSLSKGTIMIAINTGKSKTVKIDAVEGFKKLETQSQAMRIENVWDIFSKNEQAITADFELLTKGRKSKIISKTNQLIAPENIFLEEGAKVECAILNASAGPIYIGKDAEVMEGAIVRGHFALCEHSTLKMGAKIYGATTVGPHSKVGGELSNSVILGYSNKGHDGFLGNSVIGEWCNIGADSNNSNLKNNYSQVKLWNYQKEVFVNTGLTFCGLIMGDHSKCSINTMFNTGTVVGVNANVFGTGFPSNFVHSFSWGGISSASSYKLKKAVEVAKRVFERRSLVFDKTEEDILAHVFELTKKYRV